MHVDLPGAVFPGRVGERRAHDGVQRIEGHRLTEAGLRAAVGCGECPDQPVGLRAAEVADKQERGSRVGAGGVISRHADEDEKIRDRHGRAKFIRGDGCGGGQFFYLTPCVRSAAVPLENVGGAGIGQARHIGQRGTDHRRGAVERDASAERIASGRIG